MCLKKITTVISHWFVTKRQSNATQLPERESQDAGFKKPIFIFGLFFIFAYFFHHTNVPYRYSEKSQINLLQKTNESHLEDSNVSIENVVIQETGEKDANIFIKRMSEKYGRKRQSDANLYNDFVNFYKLQDGNFSSKSEYPSVTSEPHIAMCPETETISTRKSLLLSMFYPIKTSFKVDVEKTVDKSVNLENLYPMVQNGGYYKPLGCQARYKVAILVPYRNRQENLRVFLYNIHPFLMRQNLEYRIFVIEQSGGSFFNKGRLFNAGFLEIERMGGWQCVVYHDVDLLPTDDRIRYSCPKLPRHMCGAVIEKEKDLSYHAVFGGVTAMTFWQYRIVNGYSNLYWRWGAEDDDMYIRLQTSGVGATRYKKKIARYTALPHPPSPKNPLRRKLLKNTHVRYKKDGLSNVRYQKLDISLHHLYTKFLINVDF